MDKEVQHILGRPQPFGEKLKALIKLFQHLSSIEKDERLLRSLKSNPGARELRLKLADKFQSSGAVLDVLQSGDGECTRQVLKFRWLWKGDSDFTSAPFLTAVFPTLSFVVRQRIIRSLGLHLKDPLVADEVYSALETKYGFLGARPLLPACTETLIRKILMEKQVVFSPKELLVIVKRLPELCLDYLTNQDNGWNNNYYRFNYFVCLEYLFDNLQKYRTGVVRDHSFPLGKRRTRRLFKTCPSDAVELFEKNCSLFSLAAAERKLTSEQYQSAFQKAFPNIGDKLLIPHGLSHMSSWLEPLSKTRKLQLIQNSFRAVFRKDLLDCPEYFQPSLMNLLPSDQRASIIAWKLKNSETATISFSVDKEQSYSLKSTLLWIAMKPTAESIPELVRILNPENDVGNRIELHNALLTSCIFNKDSEALKKVLQLLTQKCRNDQPHVRRNLFHILITASRHFEFGEEEWACFQELLQLIKLYNEVDSRVEYLLIFLPKLAEFHIQQNQPFDQEMSLYLEHCEHPRFFPRLRSSKNQEVRKRLLEAVVHSVRTSGRDFHFIANLIEEIREWNKHFSKKPGNSSIDWAHSYPWLKDRCAELLEQPTGHGPTPDYQRIDPTPFYETKSFLLKRDPQHINRIINSGFYTEDILLRAWQCYPSKILDNIIKIASKIIHESLPPSYVPYLQFLRKIKFEPEAAQLLVNECKTIFQNKGTIKETCNAIKILSVVQTPSEFLAWTQDYYPMEARIDPSKIDPMDFGIKSAIVRSYKHLDASGDVLQAVDKFCKGDYLKLAIGTLYSVCIKVPEAEALLFLRSRLKDLPVSVKKHMIRLFFTISPIAERINILGSRWKDERHPSIRYENLLQIYSLLQDTPTRDAWELLKSAVESLTEADSPSLKHIAENRSLDTVLDVGLTTEFFETVLQTCRRNSILITPVLVRIIGNISKVESELLETLLTDLIPGVKIYSVSLYSDFILAYLLDGSVPSAIQECRLQFIQKTLQVLVDRSWNFSEKAIESRHVSYPARSLLTRIVHGASVKTVPKDQVPHQIQTLKCLIHILESVQDIPETFLNVFSTKLALSWLELKENKGNDDEATVQLKYFGRSAAALLKSYREVYGNEIIAITSPLIQKVGYYILSVTKTGSMLNIIDGILSQGLTRANLMTAIDLLPSSRPNTGVPLEIYERVLSVIHGSRDLTVRIYFNKLHLGAPS